MSAWLTSVPVGVVVWVVLLVICVTGAILIEMNLTTTRLARRLLWGGFVLGGVWLLLVAWRFVVRA